LKSFSQCQRIFYEYVQNWTCEFTTRLSINDVTQILKIFNPPTPLFLLYRGGRRTTACAVVSHKKLAVSLKNNIFFFFSEATKPTVGLVDNCTCVTIPFPLSVNSLWMHPYEFYSLICCLFLLSCFNKIYFLALFANFK
jgi:hypothetical protein